MNPYTEMIDEYVNGLPEQPDVEVEPLDKGENLDVVKNDSGLPLESPNDFEQAHQEVIAQDTVQIKQAQLAASEDGDSNYAKYYEIARREQIPTHVVKDNWDFFKRKEDNLKAEEIAIESPKTAKFFSNPENMKLYKNDIDFFSKFEGITRKIPQRREEQDHFFFGGEGSYIDTKMKKGIANTYQSVTAFTHVVSGVGNSEEISKKLAKQESHIQYLQSQAPETEKQFHQMLEKEQGDVNKAWQQSIVFWDQWKKDSSFLNAVYLLGSTTELGVESADLVFTSLFDHPKETIGMIVENTPQSIPTLAAAGIGTIAGSPLGGAAAAGIVGGYMGTSMEFMEEMRNSVKNMSDPKEIQAFLDNPETVRKARNRALKKGLAVGVLDAVSSGIAGSLIRSVKPLATGASTAQKLTYAAKKAGAFTAETVAQGVGEGVGEIGGQFVREDFDPTKVDFGSGVVESVAGMGQGAIMTSIGGARNQLHYRNMKKNLQGLKQQIEGGNKLQSIKEMVEQVKKSKTLEITPQPVESFIQEITEGDTLHAQGSDWQNLFGDQALEKADELLPNGRADLIESLKTGNPIEIDTSDYVMNISQKEDISSIIRSEVDGLTESEIGQAIELVDQNLKKNLESVKNQLETEKKSRENFDSVQDQIRDQLTSQGIKREEADLFVASLEPMRVLAERNGMNPDDLFKRYNLKIERGDGVESFSLLQSDDKGNRGGIKISSKKEITIGLFKTANKSTWFHEIGHLYLEVMADLAEDINTSEDIRNDFGSVLRALGIENRSQIESKHHEIFAKTFERYLETAQAPNARMERVFNKFRTYMVGTYGSALRKNVPMSKDIQEVMSRLYASQEEINNLMDEQFLAKGDIEEFIDALKLNDKDRAKIVEAHHKAREEAETRLVQERMKELKKEERKKRTKIYKEERSIVEAEVSEMKVYKAIDKAKEIKINTQQVIAQIGRKNYEKLPKGLTSPKGVDIEIAGDILGYTTTYHFIKDVLNNPTKEHVINVETDRRAKERLGPERSDQFIKQKAQTVLTEKTSRLKKFELEAMFNNAPAEFKKEIKRLAAKLPKDAELDRIVSNKVGDLTVGEFKPAIFQRLENKARKLSMVLLTKGEFVEAFKQKFNERFNHETYRKSLDHRDKTEKFVKKVKRVFALKKVEKKYEMDYLNVAKAILDNFKIIPLTEKKKKNVLQYMETLKEVNEVGFDKVNSLFQSLSDIPSSNLKEISIRDHNKIMDTVEAIMELARTEKTIETVQGAEDRDTLLNEFMKETEAIPKKVLNKEFSDDWWDIGFLKNLVLGESVVSTRVSHFLNFLGGNKTFSSMMRALVHPLREAQTRFQIERGKAGEQLKTIIENKALFKIYRNKKKIDLTDFFPGLKHTEEGHNVVTQSDLLVMLFNSGNKSNLEKMLVGRGMGSINMEGELDATQYNNFLSKMLDEGMITPEMVDATNKVHELLESYKPELQKVYKKLTGTFMGEIKGESFTIKGKDSNLVIKGGYYPAIYDSKLVNDRSTKQNEVFESEKMKETYASVPTGMGKDRVDNYRKAVSFEFSGVVKALDDTVKVLTLGTAVADAQKITRNRKFRERVDSILPKASTVLFDKWISNIALQKTITLPENNYHRSLARLGLRLNQNASKAILGLNVKNIAEQFFETAKYLPEFDSSKDGAKRMGAEVKKLLKGNLGYIDAVKDLSPYMKERLENISRKFFADLDDLTVKKGDIARFYDGTIGKVSDHTMVGQRMVSHMVEPVVWSSFYNQALEQGVSPKKAVLFADDKINRIGGDNTPFDVSPSESTTVLGKILTPFVGYFVNVHNFIKYGGGSKRSRAFWGMTVPAMSSIMIVMLLKGRIDEDEDGEILDDLTYQLLFGHISYATARSPFTSAPVRLLESWTDDVYWNDRFNVSPLISGIEGISGAINLVRKDEPNKSDKKKAIQAMGVLTGLPTKPFKALVDDE